MNKTIYAGLLAVMFIAGMGSLQLGFAYLGNVGADGETGKNTLEEALKLQAARVAAAQNNPGAGSGTPYIDANGVVGATVISSAIFGGIAAAFFFRSRSGKYAAMGRG